jgi:hypothetical protein
MNRRRLIPVLGLLVTMLMLASTAAPASAEPSSGRGLTAALIVNNPGPQTVSRITKTACR